MIGQVGRGKDGMRRMNMNSNLPYVSTGFASTIHRRNGAGGLGNNFPHPPRLYDPGNIYYGFRFHQLTNPAAFVPPDAPVYSEQAFGPSDRARTPRNWKAARPMQRAL